MAHKKISSFVRLVQSYFHKSARPPIVRENSLCARINQSRRKVETRWEGHTEV